MRFNFPKNDNNYYWTDHVKRKMLFYHLTADKVTRTIRVPKRVEEGVADNTIAVMQPAGTKNKPTEIWVMYSLSKKASTLSEQSESKGKSFNNKKVIISAWRYPGISPVGKKIPIPADILEELKKEGTTS